jgi:chromosome partitioning protein
VLLTMYDARLNLSRQVADEAKEYFGARMFKTVIPRNVRLAEAPSFGQPILMYDIGSIGAQTYLSVAEELIKRTVSRTAAEAIEAARIPAIEAS